MTSGTASQSIPAGRTDDVPPRRDERTILTSLVYARDTVHAKCEGLSDADARRAPLPGACGSAGRACPAPRLAGFRPGTSR